MGGASPPLHGASAAADAAAPSSTDMDARRNSDGAEPLAGWTAESDTAGRLPTETQIRALVNSFYEVARRDDLLGPVFEEHVEDWSVHMPKLYDFWSAVVLRTGRYSGRPIDAHGGLGLTPAHFARWMALWEDAVKRVIPPAARGAFTLPAGRMGAAMSSRLFEQGE